MQEKRRNEVAQKRKELEKINMSQKMMNMNKKSIRENIEEHMKLLVFQRKKQQQFIHQWVF